MVYEILGIERFEGISKETGRPYDFTRFYTAPSRQPDKIRGRCVEQVDIWNSKYAPDISDIRPEDFVGISYGRGGFVEECRLVNSPNQWERNPRPPVQPRGREYPLPLDYRECQVPNGSDSSCHEYAYRVANIRNQQKVVAG